jgi:hypothetical protein
MMGQLHLLNAGKNKPRLSYSEAGLNVAVEGIEPPTSRL